MIEAYFNGTYVAPINYVNYKESEPIKEAFISRQTANGANILDPSPAVVEMIKGKTVKSTNLIPFPYSVGTGTRSGVDVTVNADGSISVKGTATDNLYIALGNYSQDIFPAGTYYISGHNSGVASLYIEYYQDTTYVKSHQNNRAFTLDWNGYNKIRIYYFIGNGKTVDGTLYPMLNDGDTAKPFVPYFSGLKHANFKTIKSTGKQLIPFPYRFVSGTRSGVAITVNNDGTILLNGTSEKQFYMTMCILYPETLPKGTYTLSGEPIGDISIGADAKTADGKWIKTLALKDRTFAVDWNGYERIDFYYVVQTGAVLDNLTVYPMLNFGSTAQPFEPYKVEEYTDGNSYELAEYDYINPQKSELVKATKQIVFDGTEYWRLDNTNEYGIVNFVTNILSGVGRANIGISNYYDLQTDTLAYTTKTGFFYNGSGLYFREISYLTEADWKAHLAELYANGTPLMVEIELLTPTIETLTDYPKEYTANNGGSEVVEQGDTDNSQWGAICEITVQYFTPSEENILMLCDIFVKEE